MIRGLIYLAVFTGGAVAGGLFPAFSLQYHQQLQARYEQVSIDLAPFETIAERFHNGSLDELVQHHLNSSDPTFHAEGEAIQAMINSRSMLAESQAAASESYASQASWLYNNRDDALVRSTWQSFEPALITSSKAVGFALGIGSAAAIALWLAFAALGYAFSHATKRLAGS